MKKLLFIIGLALLSLTISAQSKISIDNLIGYWEPNRHASQTIFWKDTQNRLQLVQFSTVDGGILRLISMKIVNNTLVVKTIRDENKWEVESSYTFIGKDTLQCIVKGPINGTIVYTKIK